MNITMLAEIANQSKPLSESNLEMITKIMATIEKTGLKY